MSTRETLGGNLQTCINKNSFQNEGKMIYFLDTSSNGEHQLIARGRLIQGAMYSVAR